MKTTKILAILVLVFGMIASVANADFTFGTPTNLGAPVNSSYQEYGLSISADGLSLFFESTRSGGYGSGDLWVTKRPTKDDSWGQPVNLGPKVNDPALDHDPSISADGLTLYFTSYNRPGGRGGNDLWVTRRATVNDPWDTPVNLGSSVNSLNDDMDPSLSADGQELYFCSNRPGGNGNIDIWITEQQTTRQMTERVWGKTINLGPNVNTSYSDHSPSISADGLVLFFCSNRPGGYGNIDLWMTKRPTTDADWGEPVNLGPMVNGPGAEDDPCISADGLWLFFNFVVGLENIWQAPVIPIVDLNGDGIVDSADICIMVDHWGTDEPLCDIGPMPWGDGIVDVQDLIVLAEHLFEEIPPVE